MERLVKRVPSLVQFIHSCTFYTALLIVKLKAEFLTIYEIVTQYSKTRTFLQ